MKIKADYANEPQWKNLTGDCPQHVVGVEL